MCMYIHIIYTLWAEWGGAHEETADARRWRGLSKSNENRFAWASGIPCDSKKSVEKFDVHKSIHVCMYIHMWLSRSKENRTACASGIPCDSKERLVTLEMHICIHICKYICMYIYICIGLTRYICRVNPARAL